MITLPSLVGLALAAQITLASGIAAFLGCLGAASIIRALARLRAATNSQVTKMYN